VSSPRADNSPEFCITSGDYHAVASTVFLPTL